MSNGCFRNYSNLHASQRHQAEAANLWSEYQVSKSALKSIALLGSRELQKSFFIAKLLKILCSIYYPTLGYSHVNVRVTGPLTWPEELILLATQWVLMFTWCPVWRCVSEEEGQEIRESKSARARTVDACITGICLSLKGHRNCNSHAW